MNDLYEAFFRRAVCISLVFCICLIYVSLCERSWSQELDLVDLFGVMFITPFVVAVLYK